MNPPDIPVQVPIDNPNADTEWNDILRAHDIIPPKPQDPEPIIQEALLEAHQRAHANRLEHATLSELSDLEDLEDESFLESYRQKRLAELSSLAAAAKFGSVLPLQKSEYAKEVTEASKECFVVVAMLSGTAAAHTNSIESKLLEQTLLPQLAQKYPEVKVLRIRADLCVEGYPERNTPTLLVYKDTNIARQVVTLAGLDGVRTKVGNLERLLVEIGAVKEGDSRLREGADGDEEGAGQEKKGIRSGGLGRGTSAQDGDDDDDWD